MTKIYSYEQEVLAALEKGRLRSVASIVDLEKLKAATKATALKRPHAEGLPAQRLFGPVDAPVLATAGQLDFGAFPNDLDLAGGGID